MVSLLKRVPAFRRLFLAHAISRAGDAFNAVALVVLVFRLTGSGIGVAATVAFEVVPLVLLGPVAGMIVDRYPRRRIMLIADLVRAGLAALLAVAHGSVAVAYGVAFGLSVGSMLFNPAASSLLPDLVDDEGLVEANSALWVVAVIAQVVLAPFAGALIAWAGVGPAFGLNAVSYLASAWWLARLGITERVRSIASHGWRAVRAGVELVRRDQLLTRLAVVQLLASLSAGATSGLLVVLAAEWLQVGPSGFGLLLSCIGIGAAAGPFLLRRQVRPGDKRWLFGPYALRGGVDLVLVGVRSPAVAGAALGLYGVSTSTGMITYQSTLQRVVPDDTRGRVFAFYDLVWNAARLVSLGLGGLLADALSIRAVYLVGAALLLAAAAIGLGAPLQTGVPVPAEPRDRR